MFSLYYAVSLTSCGHLTKVVDRRRSTAVRSPLGGSYTFPWFFASSTVTNLKILTSFFQSYRLIEKKIQNSLK